MPATGARSDERAGGRSEDRRLMRLALALAERGRGLTSPNPLVGVVVARDGVVVGTGYHARAGGPHAEVWALGAAGAAAKGATLYSTLEPCCHTGRTGPCVVPVIEAGIARVVVALRDPNPLVNGGGLEHLRAAGLEVIEGVEQAQAERVNEVYLTNQLAGRPYVIAKIALSVDGRIARADGERTPITAVETNRRIQRLRAEVDAIAVGSTTVLVDDPLLTARGVFRARPLVRVLFDTRLRIPPSARVFSTLPAGPVIVLTSDQAIRGAPERARALRSVGARIGVVPAHDFRGALGHVFQNGVTSILLEGGRELHTAAFQAGLVDRLIAAVGPLPFGPAGVPWVEADALPTHLLAGLSARVSGVDTILDGHVHRAD